ncbi:MAG: helix-turn-helix domain-containing protein [Solirubrobacteraceae bacterium]
MSTSPAGQQLQAGTKAPAGPLAPAGPPAQDGGGPAAVGRRVRDERLRQKIGVRELARRVGVSASLISQVELGKASPSVGTLYAIVSELDLSLDELLRAQPTGPRRVHDHAARPDPVASAAVEPVTMLAPATDDPVVRHGGGQAIQLASGVRWERLTPQAPQDVDFLSVRYEVGGASCPADSLMRHDGHEYGHVLSGRLGVSVGFETHELGPGDSISFQSTMPHRLFNLGEEPVQAIWFVVGRRGDPRIVRGQSD